MATQVNRLAGKYALCYIGTGVGTPLLVAQLREWECSIATTFADATAHGDYWDVPVILRQAWEGRVGGFMTELSRVSFLSAFARSAAGTTVTPYADPTSIHFIGYYDYLTLGSGATAKKLIEGDCYITRASIEMPEGMANQELEFRGIGAPDYIGNATTNPV